ncbi:uncharacterized protein LOC118203149 isoform X2 [Stegodyphus dumicola]|uniref:uncharacterized protein LOC118203149 isoform X2 n=1 Tax=Stegodyphus dumicola TaxID=202533 RepID=UPI0015A88AD9|nr:uncharacterized protein LOC118203149 isoform X2 [Stegodyphus dumicola]
MRNFYEPLRVQEYLNRSISFIVPLSARKASERRQELERGFSALTGAHVNVHSVAFHNSSSDKSIVRCWVSYPLSSTVDLSNMDVIIGNLYGREYYLATTNVEAINRGSFNVVFWLLIVLVILMLIAILALLIYCCCVRTTEGGRDILEVKNKVAPEENIIHYKDGSIIHLNKDEKRRPDSRTRSIWQESQQVQTDPIRKNHIRTDEERPSPSHRAQQATVHDSVTTSYAQNPDDIPVRGAYYPDGGIPAVAGGRMERAYRRGRPLSPGTEMLVQEMAGDSDARRLGNYVVVRKVVRPRVRVDAVDERAGAEDTEDGPRRTEILYIRSPMREEEEERQYVRDGELLRSVSETALNTGDPHLRVPRPYRQRIVGVPQQRSEPPQDPAAQQQLKFSR